MSSFKKIKFKGGGILPTSIHNGKLYFLLGRENKYCVNGAKKYEAFTGGNEEEPIMENVCREGAEELIGFLGNKRDIYKKLNKCNKYYIGDDVFRTYIYPMEYDENIINYFNNLQEVIKEYIPKGIIKKNKIFEKDKIEWFSINDLIKRREELRKWFKITIKEIIKERNEIKTFVIECLKEGKKTKKLKSKYNRKRTMRNKR